jgi:hypothetical protein
VIHLIRLAVFSTLIALHGAATAQLPDRAAFPDLTIAELIDIGGGPTEWSAMRGMPWPVYELANRPRSEVVERAGECLQSPPKFAYSHAFCVYLLSRINPPELSTILKRSYPGLDASGRYEVLLRGYLDSDPSYIPLFTDLIAGFKGDAIDRPIVLAMSYATMVFDQNLQTAVERFVSANADAISRVDSELILDGFPYSDVVSVRVSDVQSLFSQAVDSQRVLGEARGHVMTVEESRILQGLRAGLLDPERVDLSITTESLQELVAALEHHYSGIEFEPLSPDLVAPRFDFSLTKPGASLADVLAQLCNVAPIDLAVSASDDARLTLWQHGNLLNRELEIQNACTTLKGVILRLVTGIARDDTELSIIVSATSPTNWPGLEEVKFRLDELILSDGEGVHLPVRPSIRRSSVFAIPLAGRKLDEMGALTIRGTVTLDVPLSLRRIERRVAPEESFTLNAGTLALIYEDAPGEYVVQWGASSCCVSGPGISPFHSSDVYLYDARGVALAPTSRGVRSNGASDFQVMRFRKSARNSRVPHSLVWTSFTTTEKMSFNVEFRDVLIRATETAGGQ